MPKIKVRMYRNQVLNLSEYLCKFKRSNVSSITTFCSHLMYKKHYEMKHEMARWKCFVQTHLFVTIYGLVWSSSVTFKHKKTLGHRPMSLATRHRFI